MSTKSLILWIAGFVTVIIISGIIAYVYVQNYDKQIKVAAQIEVEKAKVEHSAKVESLKIEQTSNLERKKIEEIESTKRTKSRMSWVPWYKEGQP